MFWALLVLVVGERKVIEAESHCAIGARAGLLHDLCKQGSFCGCASVSSLHDLCKQNFVLWFVQAYIYWCFVQAEIQ